MAADAAATSSELIPVVALLGAAVVMVPIIRRLGMSSILGYLIAGLIIGPFGLGWIHEPEQILHFAELGVVMFLFIVGLEMRPSHLWALRKQIFGLGSLQIGSAIVALTGLMLLLGYDWKIAFVAGAGFTMTSTPIVMQLLAERGDIALPRGQQMVSVAIFEDILIVPLLATVALLAPAASSAGAETSRWTSIGLGAASIAGLVLAGLFLLNPMFRILAKSKAREVMTAAALLVVLGAALLMQLGGLSMAMGAFLAGVLLSESSFRHQIEADIEPFRGILLGLFFIAVGMSLNIDVVRESWQVILLGVPVVMAIKGTVIYILARVLRSSHADALDRAVLMAQSGEFAFVLYSAAVSGGLLDARLNAELSAIVILSMVMTPLVVLAARPFLATPAQSLDGVEEASGLSGSVLLIGFGRFGQVTSQALLARDVDVTIIDSDVEMIQDARNFGFKIYYGDGSRLDVLEASGAGKARAIVIAVDDRDAADRIVALAKEHFPHAKLLVRSYDRGHSLSLVNAGVDYQIRETFESALKFGEAALRELGVDASEAADISDMVRDRDAERFELEIANNDTRAGRDLLIGNIAKPDPRPTPFTKPKRAAKALTEETEAVSHEDADVPEESHS